MVQIKLHPRHIKESQFLSSAQMLETKQILSLQKHIRSVDKGMTKITQRPRRRVTVFLNLHFLLFSRKRNKIYIKDAIEIYKV